MLYIEEEKEKEEKKRKRRRKKERREGEEKQGMELMFGNLVWNISFVMFGTYIFGNTCLSWVRKTLTLQYMCILVSLS